MYRRALILLLLLLPACGARPGSAPRLVRPGFNVIGRDEIVGQHAPDVLVLVQRIRPHWLGQPAAQSLDVFLEDRHVGGATDLRFYNPQEFETIEYLNAGQAQVRFMESRNKPAIVLVLRGS